jgi:hypothetical protein
MLLYITSNQNNGIFDFLKHENGMPIKKFIGDYELATFVDHDLSKFSSYRYLAVDLACLQDIPEGLFKAVDAIQDWFEQRLIIFAREIEPEIKQELLNREVYNIITGDPKEYEALILKAVGQTGIIYQDHLENNEIHEAVAIEQLPLAESIKNPVKEEQPLTEMPKQEVCNPEQEEQDTQDEQDEQNEQFIIVAGSQRRTGTTTTAIQLANYLANQGNMVAYMEANDHNHLSSIIEAYRMKEEEIDDGKWHQTKGVDYFYSDGLVMKTYDYIIFDVGVLNEDVIESFSQGDIKILCGVGKCFEREPLNQVLTFFKPEEIESINLILSFVSPEEKSVLKSFFKTAQFSQYAPNLMGWHANEALFEKVIENKLN